MRLYKQHNGAIYDDVFDKTALDTRWTALPLDAYSLSNVPGSLQLNHKPDSDSFIFMNVNSSESFILEADIDYQPIVDGDAAGLIVWEDNNNKVEFLETYDSLATNQFTKLKLIKNGNVFDFYAELNGAWQLVDSATINATKIGFISKKGSDPSLLPLNINRVTIVENDLLVIGNCMPGFTVEITSTDLSYTSSIVVDATQTKAEFKLPMSVLNGSIKVYDETNALIGQLDGDIYTGDIIQYGTFVQIADNNVELNRMQPNNLGIMMSGVLEKQLSVYNPNSIAANNVFLSIKQYNTNIGYSWADIALDISGTPGPYSDSLNIAILNPSQSVNFWVKITQDPTYMGNDPLYFEVELNHD